MLSTRDAGTMKDKNEYPNATAQRRIKRNKTFSGHGQPPSSSLNINAHSSSLGKIKRAKHHHQNNDVLSKFLDPRLLKKDGTLSAAPGMDCNDSITYHCDDLGCWDMRNLLFLCPTVARPDVPISPLEKIFYFDDGETRLGLRVGCCDVLCMTRKVSGDVALLGENGKIYWVKHATEHVDGTATVVYQYVRSVNRKGHRSFIAGIEGKNATSSNDVSIMPGILPSISKGSMFNDNKWRVITKTPQAYVFFERLIENGLCIYKYPFDSTQLQKEIDQVFPRELFFESFSSDLKKIPKLACGGPSHSTRVARKLVESPFFRSYFLSAGHVCPDGMIGNIFVSSYDNTIPRKLPPRIRSPIELQTKLARCNDIISSLSHRKICLTPNYVSGDRLAVWRRVNGKEKWYHSTVDSVLDDGRLLLKYDIGDEVTTKLSSVLFFELGKKDANIISEIVTLLKIRYYRYQKKKVEMELVVAKKSEQIRANLEKAKYI